jgi:hypothetical protein
MDRMPACRSSHLGGLAVGRRQGVGVHPAAQPVPRLQHRHLQLDISTEHAPLEALGLTVQLADLGATSTWHVHLVHMLGNCSWLAGELCHSLVA